MDELVDVVDENDEVVETLPRAEVAKKGLLYRCAAAYLERKGKIALQKRSSNKEIRPGNWSIMEETVQAGEDYKKAAYRGVLEEYGVQAQEVRLLGKKIIRDARYNDNFIVHVYRCTAQGEIRPQPDEVEKVRFLEPKQVAAMIKLGKDVCPTLVETFEMYLKGSAQYAKKK